MKMVLLNIDLIIYLLILAKLLFLRLRMNFHTDIERINMPVSLPTVFLCKDLVSVSSFLVIYI